MHIMVWAAGESRKKNHTSKVQESRLYFFCCLSPFLFKPCFVYQSRMEVCISTVRSMRSAETGPNLALALL